MIKQLLSCAAIAMALTASAETYPVSLDAMSTGSTEFYDAATKTITFQDAWGCCGWGWWSEDNGFDATNYDNFVVEIAANENMVQLVCEYADKDTYPSSTTQASAGDTKIILPLNKDGKVGIRQLYLQNSVADQTVTLTAAYFESAGEVAWEPVKWEGSQEITDWSQHLSIQPAKFIGTEKGDELHVTYTLTGTEWGSLKLATNTTDWPVLTSNADEVNEWDCIQLKESGTYKMTINAADAQTLQTTGLIVQGEKFTVTKIEVIKADEPQPQPTVPEHLYVIGQIDGNGFTPANGIEMVKADNVFTYTGMVEDADNGFGYVSFTEIQSDDWNAVNAARWAGTPDQSIADGETATLTKGVDASFKLAAGAHTFTITFADGGATLSVTGANSIDEINAAENAPAVYYDLNGRRVNEANLTNGVYVRVQGNTATKVLVK